MIFKKLKIKIFSFSPHYIFNASYARVCDFQTDAGWHQSELLVALLAAGRGQPKQKGAAQHVSVSSSSEPPGVSSGARRKREHRNRIKEDPAQYKLHREKENKRLQATSANRKPVQKAEAKIKTQKPVQEWRLQQKMLGKVERKRRRKKNKNKKPQTRAQIREKRERDRLRQQKYRASLPSQKESLAKQATSGQKKR